MALVSGSISSLVNGVSQQPAWMRLASQGEIQENAVSSLVNGVSRRPPTEHIARISATSFGDAYFHTIDRDVDRRFAVVVLDGNIRAFDLVTGEEKTVNKAVGYATYLANPSPSTGFAMTTIADFSFIMNKAITVTETNAGNAVDNSTWLYVKLAAYNTRYNVYKDGSLLATYLTGSTGVADTEYIAGQLEGAVAAALGAGWTVDRFTNTIRIKKDDNSVQHFAATDGQGGTALICFSRSISKFTDLPPSAYGGTTVEVVGSEGVTADNYWVYYDPDRASWIEVVKPEDEARPTPATMPWSLRYELDGTFTFEPIEWGWRAAGDAKTNPSPSLIGRTINNIYVHRNRLCFLADQNVIGSQPGGDNFFELYAATATTSLDTDPIDIAVSNSSGAQVPIAKHAVAFDDDLMIFTDPAQYRIGGGDILTAASVRATVTSNYASSLLAQPATNGRLIHFAIEKGEDSGIREGFIDTTTQTFDAPDITVHIPHYIKGSVHQLAQAINFDTLFVLADGAPNKVYVYKWYIESNEKLQSSWSVWTFNADVTILHLSYMDGGMYMLVRRPTGVFIERIRLDASHVDPGLDYSVRLDRKCSVVGEYDAGTNTTTWTLPYDLTGMAPVGVYGPDFTSPTKIGFQLPELTVVSAAAGTVRLIGNYSAGECIFGARYTTLYRLSQIFVPTQGDGRARTVITDGRLQLRTVFFNYTETGAFTVVVSNGGEQNVYKFGPKVGLTLTVGQTLISEGRFRVPVRARNSEVVIDITSDSHFPCSILSYDWEGEFTLRSRKV